MRNISIALRIIYPIWALVGMFGILYVPSQLVVQGDPLSTAQNIEANELLFRAGIVGSLVTQLLFIVVVLLLYRLFEDVSKNQSLVMVVFSLVSVPISMLNSLNRIAALDEIHNLDQMMFFLNMNSEGITIASIFWGLWLFPLGYLIYNSVYFPKFIGVMVLIGGVGYTISSFTRILFPNQELLLTICEFMTMGEIIWILWLVIRGPKWPKQQII